MEKNSKFSLKRSTEFFFRYLPLGLVWLYLIITAVFYSLAAVYFPTQNGDNIEHIHTSFLVALGQVPYRDFFQHHNPLLWYIFAPVVKVFAYNTTIAEVLCFISLLFFLKSLIYVYRIVSEFLADKFWALVATVILAYPGVKLYAVDFRPDNYMVFCLTGGLYYYFKYLKYQERKSLVIAFIFFFLSFMFAQKAIFPLAILGVTGIYFWVTNQIKTRDMLSALIFPIVGLILFLLYLWHYDMVKLYFVCNYTFNLNLARGFEMTRVVNVPQYVKFVFLFGWLGILYFCLHRQRYLGVLALLFVSEFIQRRFYFSPYPYYYWLLQYLAVLCACPVLHGISDKIRIKFPILETGFMVGFLWLLYSSLCGYYNMYQYSKERPYLPDYVTRQITPCDYVFNGDGMMYNIFGKDPAYYWQLIGQLDVIGEEVGLQPMPDMNMLIKKHLPKFVFGRSYFNKFSSESGKRKIVHYIDENLLDEYYDKTMFVPIYQLKEKYSNRKCQKDLYTGQWNYVD